MESQDFKAAKQAGITCTKSTQTLLPIAVGSSQEVVCAQRVWCDQTRPNDIVEDIQQVQHVIHIVYENRTSLSEDLQ